MLKRVRYALIAAVRAFRAPLLPERSEMTRQPRPVWDNGTNYDVPTFLRRGLNQSL